MALLNRKVDYALLILSYLRHTPEGGCARAIAGRFGLSRAFVANILKTLCQRQFVASHRGVKGGYLLRPAASARTLAELMDALDDTFYLAECNREAPDECWALIGAGPREVVFTSGATESDNLALKGVAAMYRRKGNHLITVRTEHKAVLDPCKRLERDGFEVTFLPVDRDGRVRPEQVAEALT